MLKKFILVTASIISVLLALLIYRQFRSDEHLVGQSGRDIEPIRVVGQQNGSDEPAPLDAGQVQVGRIDRPHFVARDEEGNITREFGFDQRLGTERDILSITEPWLKVYNGGQVITMTADAGRVPVESAAGQIQLPRSGDLEGNVVIMVSKVGNAGSGGQVAAADMTINLDEVRFELEYSQLTTDGLVRIDSPSFEMSGRGLMFQYDQLANRLQMLQVRKIDQLQIRSGRLFDAGDAERTESEADDADEPAVADDEQSAEEMTTYKIRLNNEVSISRGDEELQAETVILLLALNEKRLSASPNEPEPTTEAGQETASATDGSEAAADTVEDEWITITCEGSLSVTPVTDEEDIAVPSEEGKILLTATGEPAMLLRDEVVVVLADTITYNGQTEQMELAGGAERGVLVRPDRQSQLMAQQKISYNQGSGMIALHGPGEFDLQRPEPQSAVRGSYLDSVTIQLDSSATAKADGVDLGGQKPDWLEFNGRLELTAGQQQLRADRGRIDFSSQAENAAEVESEDADLAADMEKIELWDDVYAQNEQSEFRCEHVRVNFAADGLGGNVLNTIAADGNVYAEDPNYIFQATESLLLTFAGRERQEAEQASSEEVSAGSEVGQGLGLQSAFADSSLQSIAATGANNGIQLTDRERGYQISGDRVQADVATGLWQVWGEPATIAGLTEHEQLQGSLITLDQQTQECTISGAGDISVMTQTDLNGRELQEPSPVDITWQDGATYNMAEKSITLNDVMVRTESSDIAARESYEMVCQRLEVELRPEQGQAEGDAAQVGSAVFSEGNRVKQLRAIGPVRLVGQRWDAITDMPIRHIELNGQTLLFDQETGVLDIAGPGWVEMLNYRGTTTNEDSEQDAAGGSVDSMLGNMFSSETPNYSLVQFSELLSYDQNSSELVLSDNVRLDRLPLDGNSVPTAAEAMNTEGLMRLDCSRLELTLANPNNAENVGESADMIAGGRLSRLKAEDNVFFETVNQGRHHIFIAESAEYDSMTNMMEFSGSQRLPVRFDDMQFLHVVYDLGSGDFEAQPFGPSEIAP